MKYHHPLRILHCPDVIGGNPVTLARFERKLGLDSSSIVFYPNKFGYKPDKILGHVGDSPLIREIRRWQLLWKALRDFDVIHFNFGDSILSTRIYSTDPVLNSSLSKRIYILIANLYKLILGNRDLPLLKNAGKGIVVTYQGDDARQGDYCLEHFDICCAKETPPGYYSPDTDSDKRKRISIFDKYADKIYALNPDLLNILPSRAEFLPYTHIELSDWSPKSTTTYSVHNKVPIVIHAPSNRGVKGTRYILDAVSRLKAEGVQFEFQIIEGIGQVEARRFYEQADLLIDQLLVGWYGGVAVELMALGKPVICYLRRDDLKFIQAEMMQDLPIIDASPETIYTVMKEYLTVRKEELVEIGRRGRVYVEKWHDPYKIAVRLKSEYESIMSQKGRF